MGRGEFRIANVDDILILESFDRPFHYKKDIRREIAGPNKSSFRWIVYEEDGGIITVVYTVAGVLQSR